MKSKLLAAYTPPSGVSSPPYINVSLDDDVVMITVRDASSQTSVFPLTPADARRLFTEALANLEGDPS